MTDIFGKFASAASVFIVSAYPEADEKTPYLSRQEVFPVAETPTNTEYQANFVVAKVCPFFLSFFFLSGPMLTVAAALL